jgi:hypothetical protein
MTNSSMPADLSDFLVRQPRFLQPDSTPAGPPSLMPACLFLRRSLNLQLTKDSSSSLYNACFAPWSAQTLLGLGINPSEHASPSISPWKKAWIELVARWSDVVAISGGSSVGIIILSCSLRHRSYMKSILSFLWFLPALHQHSSPSFAYSLPTLQS